MPCWCFGKFFALGLLKGEIICTGEMRPALYFEDKKALNLYTGNEICRNSTFTNITVYILKRVCFQVILPIFMSCGYWGKYAHAGCYRDGLNVFYGTKGYGIISGDWDL